MKQKKFDYIITEIEVKMNDFILENNIQRKDIINIVTTPIGYELWYWENK